MELLIGQDFIGNLETKIADNDDIAAIVGHLKDIQCDQVKGELDIDLFATQIIAEIETRSACQSSNNGLKDLIGCGAWLLKLQQQKHCHSFAKSSTYIDFANCLIRLLEEAKQCNSSDITVCASITLNYLFNCYQEYSKDVFVDVYHVNHYGLVKHLQTNTEPTLRYLTVLNYHVILGTLVDVRLTSEHDEIFHESGLHVMQMLSHQELYNSDLAIDRATVLQCLEILLVVIGNHPTFADVYAGNLFDLLKNYVQYDGTLRSDVFQCPEHPSKSDAAIINIWDEEEESSSGKSQQAPKYKGKALKTAKAKKLKCQERIFTQADTRIFNRADMENEEGNESPPPPPPPPGTKCDSAERALVRLISAYFIGCLGRTLPPRSLYNYWSKLFPCREGQWLNKCL